MLWLFVALIPLSCLFSALALAVAAMARSSKEGQYYLMPLMSGYPATCAVANAAWDELIGRHQPNSCDGHVSAGQIAG